MKKKKVLFISSTGGHFNELQQLKPLFEKYDYHIVTEKDNSTIGAKEKYGDKIKTARAESLLAQKSLDI